MAVVEQIISVEKHDGYYITLALVGDEEYSGWSRKPDEYQVGDKVEVFYDDRYDKPKMRKSIDLS